MAAAGRGAERAGGRDGPGGRRRLSRALPPAAVGGPEGRAARAGQRLLPVLRLPRQYSTVSSLLDSAQYSGRASFIKPNSSVFLQTTKHWHRVAGLCGGREPGCSGEAVVGAGAGRSWADHHTQRENGSLLRSPGRGHHHRSRHRHCRPFRYGQSKIQNLVNFKLQSESHAPELGNLTIHQDQTPLDICGITYLYLSTWLGCNGLLHLRKSYFRYSSRQPVGGLMVDDRIQFWAVLTPPPPPAGAWPGPPPAGSAHRSLLNTTSNTSFTCQSQWLMILGIL